MNITEVTDTYGDTANVYTLGGRVYVTTVENPGDDKWEKQAELSFKPGGARKFAKAVKRAAKAAKAAERGKTYL